MGKDGMTRSGKPGRFELKVTGTFGAAHNLRNYKGKCEELHGHNWKVEAVVSGRRLDGTGMLIDFKKIKSVLRRVTDRLDHKYLNRLSRFRRLNPTSENIARYIFESAAPGMRRSGCTLVSISVWETATSCATYYEEE